MCVALGVARLAAKPAPSVARRAHATTTTCTAAASSGTQPSTTGGSSGTLNYEDAGVDISLSVQSMSQKVLLRTIPRQALSMSAAKLASRAKAQRRPSAIPQLHDAASSPEASVEARRAAVAQLQACPDLPQLHQQLQQLVTQLDARGLSAAAACVVKLLQQRRQHWHRHQHHQPGSGRSVAVGMGLLDEQKEEANGWAGGQQQEWAAALTAEGVQEQHTSGADATSSGSSSSSSGDEGSVVIQSEVPTVGSSSLQQQQEAGLEARRSSHILASTSEAADTVGGDAGSMTERRAREAARLAAACIADRATGLCGSITAQQASTIIHCMAQAGHHSHPLVQRLLAGEHMRQELGALTAAEHFRLVWGLAVLDAKPPAEWLQEWCKASQSRFHQAQPLHLAIYAWALARLKHPPSDLWLHCLLEATEPLLPRMEPQNLCNLVWGLGRIGAKPTPEWADQCLEAAQLLLQNNQQQVKACGVSMLLYGMVLMGMQPTPSFLEVCLEGVEARLPRHTALDDCNLVWALAAWRYPPSPAFMDAFATHSQRRLHTATAKDLALTAWALASLGYRPPLPWLTHYYARSLAALPQHHPADIIATLLATHRWGLALDRHYAAQLLSRTKETLRRFSLRNHVTLLWCLTQLRLTVPPAWLVVHLRHVRNHLPAMDAQAASVLLYCAAVLAPGEKAERRQFVHDAKPDVWRLVQRSHELLYKAGPQELYAFIVALMRLQVNPGIKYLRAHVRAVRAQGAAYSREQVVAMRAAYQQLGRKPPLLQQVDRLR